MDGEEQKVSNDEVESITVQVDSEKTRTSYKKMVFFGFVLVMPTFLSGFNTSYAAVSLPQMNLDINDSSWFASVAIYASPISVLVIGVLIDKFGRKAALLYAIIPSMFGWLLLYWNHSLLTILLGQALNGLSIGAGFYPVQVYAGECVMVDDVRFRNVFMTWISLSTSVGTTAMLLLGNFFDYQQICLISVVLSAIMFVTYCVVVPESPVWLYTQGRIGDAEWSERRLGIAQPILRSLSQRPTYEPINPEVRETTILRKVQLITRPDVYKPTIILTLAATLLSLCGTSTIISYMINVIDNTIPGVENSLGQSDVNRRPAGIAANIHLAAATNATSAQQLQLITSYRLSLYCGIFMCVGSLVSVWVFPRLGLKKMLISSKFCLVAAFLTVTYGSVVQPVNNMVVRLVGVTIVAFLVGLEIGPRLSFAGDVFPVDAKGFASLPALAGSLSIATENKIFPYLRVAFGGFAYSIFAGICFLGAGYIHLFVPEVVGRTLEDITNEYADEDKD